MTPDEARKLLEEHIDSGTDVNWESPSCHLPIKDEVVLGRFLGESETGHYQYEQYTFIGLLKIAYGL